MTKVEKAIELFKRSHQVTELNEYGHRTVGAILPFIEAVELPSGDVEVFYRVVKSVEGTEERSVIYSAERLEQ